MKLKLYLVACLAAILSVAHGANYHAAALASLRIQNTLQLGTTIQVANANGPTVRPTSGSYVTIPLSAGSQSVSICIVGTYTGSIEIWEQLNGSTTRFKLDAGSYTNISALNTPGIGATSQGIWKTKISGAGTLYAIGNNSFSGSASVVLWAGPDGGTLVGETPSTAPLIATVAQGVAEVAPPASWASGTDWVPASSPPCPSNIKYIWPNLASGTQATFKYDWNNGTTSGTSIRHFVSGGYLQMPPGLTITKIYAPANGSTGLLIDLVGY